MLTLLFERTLCHETNFDYYYYGNAFETWIETKISNFLKMSWSRSGRNGRIHDPSHLDLLKFLGRVLKWNIKSDTGNFFRMNDNKILSRPENKKKMMCFYMPIRKFFGFFPLYFGNMQVIIVCRSSFSIPRQRQKCQNINWSMRKFPIGNFSFSNFFK